MLTFINLMQTNTTDRFPLRRVLLTALLFMLFGTALELYLLEHFEGTLQIIPFLCLGTSGTLVVVLLFHRNKGIIRLFKLVLSLTALSGLYGTFLHLRANYEFEQEMKPTAKSWDLFVESLSGALPTLAPASMIVLALIGYSFVKLIKQE